MRFIIMLSVLLGLFGSPVGAEPRVALVIGNGNYPDLPLTNPVNDAVDMQRELEKYQFTVLSPVLNGNKQTMEKAIEDFVDKISGGTALFYYSGHGAEAGGKNYIFPVGRTFRDAADVREYALSVNWILDKMRDSGARVNIVILDACLEEKKGTGNAGFAQMNAAGVIVSYATTQGQYSLGAKGQRNSIYTGSLLNVLRGNSGYLPIERVFKNAGTAVAKNTGFVQVPTILTALMGEDFCFGICGQEVVIRPPPEPPQVPLQSQQEGTFQDKLSSGGLGPKMVWIPAGRFKMGSNEGESDEKPVHWVNVEKFAMGQYEVTFEEYDRFAQATGREEPDDEGWGRGKRPVINIDWNDAVAYAKWLSQQTGRTYRLPTEAEWEYAARAGTTTDYWWGNTASHEYANYGKDECCSGLVQGKDQWEFTAPVGSFGSNPFGLYDTAGNVWEWTCSRYTDKYDGSEIECDITNDGRRVLRGGSWTSVPNGVRAALRDWSDLTDRYAGGVRVVGFTR